MQKAASSTSPFSEDERELWERILMATSGLIDLGEADPEEVVDAENVKLKVSNGADISSINHPCLPSTFSLS